MPKKTAGKKAVVTKITRKQKIAQHLKSLAKKNGDSLTPDLLVQDASNPKSPIHDEFEWDDAKCGHAYRLDQARKLIGEVRYLYHTTTTLVKTVAYVKDPRIPNDQGYLSVAKVKTQKEEALETLVMEFRRAAGMLARVRDLAKVFEMEYELEKLLEQINLMSTNVQLKAAA